MGQNAHCLGKNNPQSSFCSKEEIHGILFENRPLFTIYVNLYLNATIRGIKFKS